MQFAESFSLFLKEIVKKRANSKVPGSSLTISAPQESGNAGFFRG